MLNLNYVLFKFQFTFFNAKLNHARMNPIWPHRSVSAYVAQQVINNSSGLS